MAGWIRVEADVHRHPRVVSLPSAAARWAFIVTLAEGKAVDGRWASEAHYRACVPPQEARHLQALISAGLVLRDGDAVVIHDWSDYQVSRKDPTAAERMRRHRMRQRDDEHEPSQSVTLRRNGPVTSRAVSLSPSLSPSPDTDGADSQVAPGGSDAIAAMQLLEELTGRPFGWGPGSKVADLVIADVAELGFDRVTAEYRQVKAEANGTPIDIAGVVYGAHKRLYRIPDAPRQGKAAAAPKGMVQPIDEILEAVRAQQ